MKLRRRFTALVLALVMVFSLTVSANAAAAQTVTAKLSPNITVTLDGEAQAMTDVNGNPVYPVLYARLDLDENGNFVPANPTGWIRLDPTNARVPSATANDNNYKTSEYY